MGRFSWKNAHRVMPHLVHSVVLDYGVVCMYAEALPRLLCEKHPFGLDGRIHSQGHAALSEKPFFIEEELLPHADVNDRFY
jgi:hypothetical protein